MGTEDINTGQTSRRIQSRFFRVSLRGALIAVALVALFISQVLMPALRQREGRRWLESQRADYRFDAPYRANGEGANGEGANGEWYVANHGLPIPSTVIEWFGIDLFASVTAVGLQTDEIYDLRPLAQLGRIEELYINQFVHPQTDFSVLKSLRRLRKLELSKWSGVDRNQLQLISGMLPEVEIVAEEFPEFHSHAAE